MAIISNEFYIYSVFNLKLTVLVLYRILKVGRIKTCILRSANANVKMVFEFGVNNNDNNGMVLLNFIC